MKYGKAVIEHNGRTWGSEKHKLLYVGIPKTASSSMRHAFGDKRFEVNINRLPGDKKEYKVFTVVRDPLKRFVSAIFESIKRNESPTKIRNLKNINDINKIVASVIEILETDGFEEVHLAPQSAYFKNSNGENFKFDKVLLFESLEKDFNEMCKDFGVDMKLEHKQKGDKEKSRKALSIIESNEDYKKRIKKLYKEDFDLYKKIENGK